MMTYVRRSTHNIACRLTTAMLGILALVAPHAILAADGGGAIGSGVAPVVFHEPLPDLEVKVLGGKITVQRSFAENRWHPNYNWLPLKLTFDTIDGSVKSITRGKAEFTKTAPGVFAYQKRSVIRQNANGFRWSDRSGNWIDYDPNGNIQAYGNRNNVKVSFRYETVGTTRRISGISDHLDRQVIWYEYNASGQLSAIRDYTGRKVEYAYTNGNLVSVIDVNGNTWNYGYTGSLPTTFTDPEGRTVTRTWPSNGELGSMRYSDGVGVDYKYEYDSSKEVFYRQEKITGGRIIETWINKEGEVIRQDLNGKTVFVRTSDTAARVWTETNARGSKTTYEHDQWDNVTKITYPDGAVVSNTYDPQFSQLTQQVDERGTITKYEYNAQGDRTRLIEAFGRPEQRITEFTYDEYGRKRSEKKVGSSVRLFDNSVVAVSDATFTFEYDDYGNLTATVDPESYRTEWSDFDALGNPRSNKDARSNVWTTTYDNRGHIVAEVDPLGRTQTHTYDKVGRKIKSTDAANNTTVFAFDARDNTVATTDPYGLVMRFEYNNDNQLTRRTNGDGGSQVLAYDIDGRLIKLIDENGDAIQYVYGEAGNGMENLLAKVIYPTFTQEYKYDARSRIIETVDVVDATTRLSTKTTYDAASNRTSLTDKEGKTTTYEYDAVKRVAKVTNAALGTTQFAYDNRDNLVALKDARGNTHRYNYDRRNLKVSETRPLGQSTTYAYDPTGQVESITDAKGQVKKYTYDSARRRVGEAHHAAGSNTASKVIIFSFNDLDLLAGYDDGVTTASATYDTRQLRKISETVNYGAVTLGYAATYEARGAKASFTGPDGVTVSYAHDAGDRLSGITLPVGSITVSGYKSSAPTQIVFPGGTTRSIDYDAFSRVKAIRVKDPAQNEILSYQYTHDRSGNIIVKATEHGTYSYSFDSLYQLTAAANPSPLVAESYTYDAVGNRLTDSAVPGTWVYDENNRLTQQGNATLEYDANGNLTRRVENNTARIFEYDLNNRVVAVRNENGALVASYGYDPFGRRLWKEINAQRTFFLYSEQGLVAEATSTGAVTRMYGYWPESKWGTAPVYVKQDANYFFYLNDHIGTPQKVVNSDGSVMWSGKTQAFGAATVISSGITNNLRFPGQYFDEETNLHYNWYRYYDPTSGRYLTYDPSNRKAGINRYTYVEMNPVTYYDNQGLFLSPHHYLYTAVVVTPFVPMCPALISVPYMAMATDWHPSWGDSQSTTNACWHAMTPPGGSKQKAEECWRKYINDNMETCTPRGLGNAIHALQDSHAGGHKDFQEYDGHFHWSHFLQDMFPTPWEEAGAIGATFAPVLDFISNCKCACFFDVCCKDKRN